ncbi:MAG: site-2 protease family protein, partial [Rickettsia endosymbiont of Ixodes ricinus]|nr:site-2 protease family protein [Rickettsia endosymbiont of Ixodes ricinus]
LFIAMLSVNLGLLNLLPIPRRVGGHHQAALISVAKQKVVNTKTKNILLQLGAIIIIFLIIISVSNDIQNLFS